MRLFRCDFCGSGTELCCYPSDVAGISWHACAACVALIRTESWGRLIERIIAACAALQFIPPHEEIAFRFELWNAVGQTHGTPLFELRVR